jgi:hypothetical protein
VHGNVGDLGAVAAQRAQQEARRTVPHLDQVIVGASEDALAVRVEGDAVRRVCVPIEHAAQAEAL